MNVQPKDSCRHRFFMRVSRVFDTLKQVTFLHCTAVSSLSSTILCEWSSTSVRAFVYCAEVLWSGLHQAWLSTCYLSTQQRMGIWWQHWGDKDSDKGAAHPSSNTDGPE